MSIAASIKSYYESEDFKNNYAMYLFEDTHEVKRRIKDICRREYYFEEHYGANIDLTDEQVEEIFEYITDNEEEFTREYNNYYVGDTCIASVNYGEQEEQLTDITNHKTGKPYGKAYLKKIFEQEDFYVTDEGDYAYYNMSDEGVYIDLLAGDIPMLRDLITLKEYGQTHGELCSSLGYDEDTADDIIMLDYIWYEKEDLWLPKIVDNESVQKYIDNIKANR